MAAVTRHLLMFSRQPEFRFVVVEPPLAPGTLRVALGTGFPQPAEMRIVFFMTIDTTGGCFPIFLTGHMTVAALDGTMFALENEVRRFMAKRFQVQLNDVRTPSLVIGMAVLALGSLHLGIAAMKPLLLFEIDTHRLVTLQTLLILSALFEQGVTLRALRFVFGVTLDHRSRHQKFLIRIGIGL